MLVRFSHIMLFTRRHAEAVRWYCDKLGYEIDYNAPGEYASLHHKILGRLALHATDSETHIGKGPMPYFLCDDIHQTIMELREKGVTVSEPNARGKALGSPISRTWTATSGALKRSDWLCRLAPALRVLHGKRSSSCHRTDSAASPRWSAGGVLVGAAPSSAIG